VAGTVSSSAANEPQSSLGFGFVMVNEETGAIPGVGVSPGAEPIEISCGLANKPSQGGTV